MSYQVHFKPYLYVRTSRFRNYVVVVVRAFPIEHWGHAVDVTVDRQTQSIKKDLVCDLFSLRHMGSHMSSSEESSFYMTELLRDIDFLPQKTFSATCCSGCQSEAISIHKQNICCHVVQLKKDGGKKKKVIFHF